MSTLARDAETAKKEVGDTLIHVTVVGMISSVFSAGVFGWELSKADPLITAKCVLVALTVDYLLFRWLRMAKMLRSIGAQTRAGTVLDVVGVGMTYYITGLGAFAVLLRPQSPFAWGLMGFAYLFIPTVMLLSYIAMPGAQLKLQEKAAEEHAIEERTRLAALEEQSSRAKAAQRDYEEVKKSENNKAAAEAAERTRKREIEDAQRVRDAETQREEIALEGKRVASLIAFSSILTMRLENSQAITEKARRQLRDRERRQRGRQPGEGASPARRQASSPGVRQPASPAPKTPKPQDTPDVAQLAKLAKHLLANEPGMGRTQLANELGVTSHYARKVLDFIKSEQDAQKDAELQQIINGGN